MYNENIENINKFNLQKTEKSSSMQNIRAEALQIVLQK